MLDVWFLDDARFPLFPLPQNESGSGVTATLNEQVAANEYREPKIVVQKNSGRLVSHPWNLVGICRE